MADNANPECITAYSGGSLAGAIVGTFVATLLLLGFIYLVWKWQKKRQMKRSGLHNLVIVEDGGGGTGGGGEGKVFAYDNPGFIDESSDAKKSNKDGGFDAKFNGAEKTASQQNGGKKMPWGPLSFLFKSRSALDDSVVEEPQKYNVALKGHDFTGLGFNICGNMRDGIFVKDVMQRGPAAESKQVVPGDQITGMTVSFKQMVLEDAITLLSYASPYEVTLEMLRLPEKSQVRKGIFVSSPTHPSTTSSGQTSTLERVCHPFFKSQSIDDLRKVGKEHLDLQVDRKKKQANGIHASKETDTPITTASASVSSGTMEIPTVVVVGNNENRSSSSSPPKRTSSAVKLPKLPKLSFSFGSPSSSSTPKSSKAPEAHQHKSAPSATVEQIEIPIPDEVDGPIVSVAKPEIVPRTKSKSTLVQKSVDEVELVEAISPAIDKMSAEFEKSKLEMKKMGASSNATAVIDVQPVEIDMKGQPSVKVEPSGGEANIDIRMPTMMAMPGSADSKKGKEKESKKKDKKAGKQKSSDIDITLPSVSYKVGIEIEGESKTQEEVKKPERSKKSKDKADKLKEKEAKASKSEKAEKPSKPEKEPKEKEMKEKDSKEQEHGESKGETSGEKSKFFKFGIPVLPDLSLNFGFGGNKSSSEDKDKEKVKDKEDKDKDTMTKEIECSNDLEMEAPVPKFEIPRASLKIQDKSLEHESVLPVMSSPEVKSDNKKDKELKEKSKSKDKKKEKDKKESKTTQPPSETEDKQQTEASGEVATGKDKEKSGSSFSFNIKLPSFEKPLLKRKDSSGSNSGDAGEKIVVDASPNASGANTSSADSPDKSLKEEKPSIEPSPKKSKQKKVKAEKKSSRPTSPEVSDGHRTTDDEGDKSMDVVDGVPGEKSSKKGSGFHMPHIGIKLPKFGHSKQTYSFENVSDNKHGHGPTAESLLEPSPSMKVEVTGNTAEFKKMTPTVDEIVPEVVVKMDQTPPPPSVVEAKRGIQEVDSSDVKVKIESPTISAPAVEIPSASLKIETKQSQKESGSVLSESEEKGGNEEMTKQEQEEKELKEKESKPSFVSKGLKGLRDFKEKVAHRLSHDHQASSGSEAEGEPGDENNKAGKQKVKKEKKVKESLEKSKEEKQREKEEKAKEKERLKAEKKLKKAELKKKLSSGAQSSSSSSSSSSDESDAEDGSTAMKTEKKGKKKSKTKESKSGKEKKSIKKEKKGEKSNKKSPLAQEIEVKMETPEIEVQKIEEKVFSASVDAKQAAGYEAKLTPVKPPVVPRKVQEETTAKKSGDEGLEMGMSSKLKVKKTKSKGGSSSSSSSSSSESDSENKKDGKEGKPKKPKRSAKRKAPEIPSPAIDMPDVVKITTSAEVISPPSEKASASKTEEEQSHKESSSSSKTPESGRKSASFADLSSLQQPKSKGEGPLERAMSMDMADKDNSTETGAIPVGSSQEDLSAVPDTKTITHLTREQHQLQGLRDSITSKSSTSSNETLKASATSVVLVHPKEPQIQESTDLEKEVDEMRRISPTTRVRFSPDINEKEQESGPSTAQKMMNETLSVMTNIVQGMDSPSLVKSAMSKNVEVVGEAKSEIDDPPPRVSFSSGESSSVTVVDEKSEVKKVAEQTVDEIIEKATSESNKASLTEVEKVAEQTINEIIEKATTESQQSMFPSKSEAEKVAEQTIDEIMEKATRSLSPEILVSLNERGMEEYEEPRVSVTTGDFNDTTELAPRSLTDGMESGADSFSIASVKIQGNDGENDEPVSVRNITVTNIKNEPEVSSDGQDSPTKQLLRQESKQRLLQTVADANEVKVTPLRKDSSLSSSSCSVDSTPDIKTETVAVHLSAEPVEGSSSSADQNGKYNGGSETIEISREELDGIMMSHAAFLEKQAVANASNPEDLLTEAGNQQLKDTFDSWVYVEQKNAANEHTCPHSSHSDPEPSTASSNDDDDTYSRNGALSPTYRMETNYKFETSEMRVTSSPIPPDEAQVKSQSTVYSTTMTLPQKTVTQITLGDPAVDTGGRIVSKITLDTSSQNPDDSSNKTESNVELPNLESLK